MWHLFHIYTCLVFSFPPSSPIHSYIYIHICIYIQYALFNLIIHRFCICKYACLFKCICFFLFVFKILFIFISIYLLYSVAFVSAIQWKVLAIGVRTSPSLWTSFPPATPILASRSLQIINLSSLCSLAASHQLSILHTESRIKCICNSPINDCREFAVTRGWKECHHLHVAAEVK